MVIGGSHISSSVVRPQLSTRPGVDWQRPMATTLKYLTASIKSNAKREEKNVGKEEQKRTTKEGEKIKGKAKTIDFYVLFNWGIFVFVFSIHIQTKFIFCGKFQLYIKGCVRVCVPVCVLGG